MKNTLRTLAALLLMAVLLLPAALAEEIMETAPEALPDLEAQVEPMLDNDEAMEGYLTGLMGLGGGGLAAPRNLGGDLTGVSKQLYDSLSASVEKVAAGELASTQITVTLEELGLDKRFYASDLGLSKITNSATALDADAKAALNKKLSFDISTLLRALLWDHPYEMYWYDKTGSKYYYNSSNAKKNVVFSATLPSITGSYTASHSNDSVYFKGNLTFRIPVVQDYAAAGNNDDFGYAVYETGDKEIGYNIFKVDTAKAGTAKKAAQTAKSVVAKYAGDSDYAKLVGYKETICSMVDYNNDAAGTGDSTYGNPWQVIWVFDGDPSTKVVCEGYAKAFQYLCDMTDFDDDGIVCITPTGTMDGQGHMWNIVHMPDTGKNYHVDVTNCDRGSVGSPDKLFMVGSANGSPDKGYTFTLSRDIPYLYYANQTVLIYSEQERTLSALSYLEDVALPIDEAHFPDADFRAAVKALCDTDGNGYLSAEENKAVTALDVSGRGIASLGGAEYLTALTSLNCGSNALTALDVSLLPKLTTLRCQNNGFKTLDVTGNAALKAVAVPNNRAVEAGVKRYLSGSSVLTCDLGVRVISGAAYEDVLELPADLKTIGANAFRGVAAQAVTVPDGCTSIGAGAFSNCPNLAEVTLPAGVTIADDAFSGSADVFILSPSDTIRAWAEAHDIGAAAE